MTAPRRLAARTLAAQDYWDLYERGMSVERWLPTSCEAVQRNLEAGAYADGLLSPRHETGVADFQARVRQARARAR